MIPDWDRAARWLSDYLAAQTNSAEVEHEWLLALTRGVNLDPDTLGQLMDQLGLPETHEGPFLAGLVLGVRAMEQDEGGEGPR